MISPEIKNFYLTSYDIIVSLKIESWKWLVSYFLGNSPAALGNEKGVYGGGDYFFFRLAGFIS
jgi:hypothetical protein